MDPGSDPRVDAYLEVLRDWQRTICRRVHELIHAADQDMPRVDRRIDRSAVTISGRMRCRTEPWHCSTRSDDLTGPIARTPMHESPRMPNIGRRTSRCRRAHELRSPRPTRS